MNITKSIEYFNPAQVKGRIHIIGCGSVGSTLAENLVRLGIQDFVLYDFDVVNAHNLANQMFFNDDIDTLKTEAVKRMMLSINPEVQVDINSNGWTPEAKLDGYVFLCVDNVNTRKEICQTNYYNNAIKAVFDVRTTLETCQLYMARWDNLKEKKFLLASMEFTHEEAQSVTPKSACGIELGVVSTIRIGVGYCVSNFVNLLNCRQFTTCMEVDAFSYSITNYLE